MDFGFVRRPKHLQVLLKNKRTPKHKIPKHTLHRDHKRHDGYSSYLLITDAVTRTVWTFLSKSKHLPLTTLEVFLSKYSLNIDTPKFVRTDLGGELARSTEF